MTSTLTRRFLLFLLLAIPACAQPATKLFSETRTAMGTKFTVHIYAVNAEHAAACFEMAFDEIERIEEALSNYRPSSELSRINRHAAQTAVTTDAEVFSLLEMALAYSKRTRGAFDITVGPLLRAWGFFKSEGRYPAAAELAEARAAVGWEKVTLDAKQRTVRFRVAGVELDPGAIGKGYAVDRVIGLLREAGVQSALVDAGSSTMVALGAPPGETGWRVNVPRPGDRNQTVSTVLLRDNSLSTSGSYEKFFRLNGRMYGHIFDPRSGAPVASVLQTTVIGPSGTVTDVLATTAFVLGPQHGKTFLAAEEGVTALWITGEERAPQLTGWNWPAALPAASTLVLQRPAKQPPAAPPSL